MCVTSRATSNAGYAALAVVLATGLVGCSGTSRSGSDAPGVPLPSPASAGPAGAAQQKLSVAQASAKDIAATLRANAVDDPEHWAKVITDNQPYPPNDPAMGRLRQLLTQQGANPATVNKIVQSLVP